VTTIKITKYIGGYSQHLTLKSRQKFNKISLNLVIIQFRPFTPNVNVIILNWCVFARNKRIWQK